MQLCLFVLLAALSSALTACDGRTGFPRSLLQSTNTQNGSAISTLAPLQLLEADSVCTFFQSGRSDPVAPLYDKWGKYDLCEMADADKWIRRASTRCHDCVSSEDLCSQHRIPKLKIHMYLNHLDPDNWQANLLPMKAYLLTQNLFKTHLYLWTDSPHTIVNENTKPFFDMFADAISVKQFDWDHEVPQTPLKGHPYFTNHAQVKTDFAGYMPGYSDLVRSLLLYNHGGLWVDGDALLLRDVYPITIQVGYQFIMRYVNTHIFYMKAKSPLGRRILELIHQLPFEDSDEWRQKILVDTCGAVGYVPYTDFEKGRDFYNFCMFRMILASEENKGNDLDNVLFDHPLGWWDQHWMNCPALQTVQTEEAYASSISTALALHTRYPGHDGYQPVKDSQHERTIKLIDNVFHNCRTRSCVQYHSMPLVDYLHYEGPVTHRHQH